MRNTNGPALPSIRGISGPSTSIIRLSNPSPATAERRCSMVATLVPFLKRVVERVVSPTYSKIAGIITTGLKSDRTKFIPEFGGAGFNCKTTF